MLTASQWMIQEPADDMKNKTSQGIIPDWNKHRAERAMIKSFQDEYSKRESKDILLALNAEGYWC